MKYTVDEIWELASEPDIDLEVDHAIRMTDGEIREDLVCRGYDVVKLEDQARAMFGLKRRRKLRVGFIAASVAALTGLGSAITAFLIESAPAVPIALSVMTASAPAPSASADNIAVYAEMTDGGDQ